MFSLEELVFINKVLAESESQDAMKLSITKTIQDTLEEANRTKECLWSFFWYCGRGGDVEGVFKATKDEVKNAIGKSVSFGEILGKHSDVHGVLEEEECELISDDPIYVMNAVESGYNPLEYIEDEYEDEE